MMMTTKLITSGQKNQIAQLFAVAGSTAAIGWLEEMAEVVLSEEAQKVITSGGNFQAMMTPELKNAFAKAFWIASGKKHLCAFELEQYFKEVLDYHVDLTGLPFPEKEGMPVYMVGGLPLTTAVIMERVTSHFKVGQYLWKTLEEGAMIRDMNQKRPQGRYMFAHTGSEEPDAKHRNKSFDDFTSEKLQCMDPSEYLLSTGFHMWKHKKWMDMVGWTRTSSLWSDGCAVCGGFDPDDQELYLCDDHRDNRSARAGPRELFLG